MTIQDLLIAWGKGRHLSEPPNGIRPPGWTQQIRNPGTATVSIPPLDEENHAIVDAAVSALHRLKPDHHYVICLSYIQGLRDGQIARRIHVSKSTARNIREQAEHWVEGRVASVDI